MPLGELGGSADLPLAERGQAGQPQPGDPVAEPVAGQPGEVAHLAEFAQLVDERAHVRQRPIAQEDDLIPAAGGSQDAHRGGRAEVQQDADPGKGHRAEAGPRKPACWKKSM
ncbi:hypothetical protein DMB66_10900 [Actinoplanes sp. ATCC 53533]|uniref:hypothetical protein n=1 Tax=Actinoplanes sp. ATCC 53533 TaxID=1288362 RepID=UPI000F76DC6C|nr:hypothetical protein [Actinoplanes sp. ATCC 53533]RSM69499.1 hypothetical protein DMB66_10900 [Actinoplanes sp. ATCC 53533]